MRSDTAIRYVLGMARPATCLVALLLAVPAVAQRSKRLEYPQLLARLTDADWLWYPPAAGERCVQFSSYDRSSDKGPGNFDAWYGNDDRGQYLRTEDRDGKKEYVMVDIDGPGVMSRLWSANPSGVLYFDIDGERVWTVDFKALTSGQIDPIVEPLAGMHSRGGNCYLPIPFGKHLKVSASKGDFYYQCNVVQLAKDSVVPSFGPAMLDQFQGEIADCVHGLAHAAQPGNDLTISRRMEYTLAWSAEPSVPARSLVRGLELQVKRPSQAVDLGAALRRVLLVVHCGDEAVARVPVSDFFCGGADWKPWHGTMLGVREDGSAYSRWPMPMPTGGRIELEIDGDLHGVEVSLLWAADTLPITVGTPLLFHASYHQEKGFASRPFRDFTVLDAKGGAGRFVGCSLLVKNPSRAWWGEGDEKFYVDGETFPSTFGTGTEDYFGYAWCSPEPFTSAFHAQTQCDGPGNYGFTSLHRSQILDSVPFQSSFRFELEVWHWVEGLQLDYSSVAYWYGAAGTTSGLPAVPPAAERTLDRLPPPPVFVAEGAIEGESLRVVAMTGGHHEVQGLSFRENTFSRDEHRWWRNANPGDTLVLAVPVAEAGKYKVTAAFTKADDYGIVQCTLDDQKLGGPFDGYATRVESSGPLDLGTVKLAKGEAMLRLVILGKNEKAKPPHMVGLDYLRLEKL
ncbi:MAG: DUF2961 domain-containing protein [Planctomycetes bacterium]|nr:DUF2961 domain-containing protein [Planctomycetota bacterium]